MQWEGKKKRRTREMTRLAGKTLILSVVDEWEKKGNLGRRSLRGISVHKNDSKFRIEKEKNREVQGSTGTYRALATITPSQSCSKVSASYMDAENMSC